MKRPEYTALYEESHLEVLRVLEQNPHLSQRELAEELGISVGKTNYCIKALVDKGLLKINNFRNNKNKSGYVYLLTPAGIAKKTELTVKFLQRKMREYEILQKEIAALKTELERTSDS
ncbi:MarR family EPS-associated transcriptional regulator [Paenalcaligenes niemegkensis]|uniref:MarR family EPS-associated transcriptional regulator n=1 Tax=Paenalcaligenes niemegkensis TaxID=2895469 RepID=UPI001EE936D7|nr:MarR family EPS-associated transcriptional regulator [Paenalcaligenes niemegkensis]MCQ9618245.1 MarR family EPS-associated transcriptional regulator [Paenalcaligenes niemegkensis]